MGVTVAPVPAMPVMDEHGGMATFVTHDESLLLIVLENDDHAVWAGLAHFMSIDLNMPPQSFYVLLDVASSLSARGSGTHNIARIA